LGTPEPIGNKLGGLPQKAPIMWVKPILEVMGSQDLMTKNFNAKLDHPGSLTALEIT
jgi:hypothetical protein